MRKQFVWLAVLSSVVGSMFGCSDSSSSPAIATEPVKVYMMSVTAAPLTQESIVLRNNSGESVDISGWTIGDSADPGAYTVPDGIVMNQGSVRNFPHYVLGFEIDDSGETLYLKDKSGAVKDSWNN